MRSFFWDAPKKQKLDVLFLPVVKQAKSSAKRSGEPTPEIVLLCDGARRPAI